MAYEGNFNTQLNRFVNQHEIVCDSYLLDATTGEISYHYTNSNNKVSIIDLGEIQLSGNPLYIKEISTDLIEIHYESHMESISIRRRIMYQKPSNLNLIGSTRSYSLDHINIIRHGDDLLFDVRHDSQHEWKDFFSNCKMFITVLTLCRVCNKGCRCGRIFENCVFTPCYIDNHGNYIGGLTAKITKILDFLIIEDITYTGTIIIVYDIINNILYNKYDEYGCFYESIISTKNIQHIVVGPNDVEIYTDDKNYYTFCSWLKELREGRTTYPVYNNIKSARKV